MKLVKPEIEIQEHELYELELMRYVMDCNRVPPGMYLMHPPSSPPWRVSQEQLLDQAIKVCKSICDRAADRHGTQLEYEKLIHHPVIKKLHDYLD